MINVGSLAAINLPFLDHTKKPGFNPAKGPREKDSVGGPLGGGRGPMMFFSLFMMFQPGFTWTWFVQPQKKWEFHGIFVG